MKRLQPIKTLATRRLKLVDHYYNAIEAFWDVSGQDHASWSNDRDLLDRGGVLKDGRWEDGDLPSHLDQAFGRGHNHWFETAETAFKSGRPYHHEEVEKRYFVGDLGVLAIVARPDEDPSLVTCYRPNTVRPVGESETQAYLKRRNARPFVRAIVRRLVRSASR